VLLGVTGKEPAGVTGKPDHRLEESPVDIERSSRELALGVRANGSPAALVTVETGDPAVAEQARRACRIDES